MIYPIYLTSIESTGAFVEIEKFPSKSVVAPSDVPVKMTLANGTGVPVVTSVTFPETMVVCAMELKLRTIPIKKEVSILNQEMISKQDAKQMDFDENSY